TTLRGLAMLKGGSQTSTLNGYQSAAWAAATASAMLPPTLKAIHFVVDFIVVSPGWAAVWWRPILSRLLRRRPLGCSPQVASRACPATLAHSLGIVKSESDPLKNRIIQ